MLVALGEDDGEREGGGGGPMKRWMREGLWEREAETGVRRPVS